MPMQTTSLFEDEATHIALTHGLEPLARIAAPNACGSPACAGVGIEDGIEEEGANCRMASLVAGCGSKASHEESRCATLGIS